MGKQWKQSQTSFGVGRAQKSLQMVIAAMKLKDILTFFFFFHCEILAQKPEKALSYQIKVRFVRDLGKAK